jgi:hypothetical protein
VLGGNDWKPNQVKAGVFTTWLGKRVCSLGNENVSAVGGSADPEDRMSFCCLGCCLSRSADVGSGGYVSLPGRGLALAPGTLRPSPGLGWTPGRPRARRNTDLA